MKMQVCVARGSPTSLVMDVTEYVTLERRSRVLREESGEKGVGGGGCYGCKLTICTLDGGLES